MATRLQRALNKAVIALNEAAKEADRYWPGATLYLEAEGNLHAMEPEPKEDQHKDASNAERQALIIASSDVRANCDVGAW